MHLFCCLYFCHCHCCGGWCCGWLLIVVNQPSNVLLLVLGIIITFMAMTFQLIMAATQVVSTLACCTEFPSHDRLIVLCTGTVVFCFLLPLRGSSFICLQWLELDGRFCTGWCCFCFFMVDCHFGFFVCFSFAQVDCCFCFLVCCFPQVIVVFVLLFFSANASHCKLPQKVWLTHRLFVVFALFCLVQYVAFFWCRMTALLTISTGWLLFLFFCLNCTNWNLFQLQVPW